MLSILMTNLYSIRIKKMKDGALLEECIYLTKQMEKGWVTPAEYEKIQITFTEALGRPVLKINHDTFEAALDVLDILVRK
jgi:hypothetical protein